jgi:HD superfamily phosphohydrolase
LPLKYRRHIYDEVYGSIGISNLENELIDSKIFQRLRRISHLGMASYVYPGAVHSRFSHSIGTMHVMSTIARNMDFREDEVKLLRLTALLHDIGHCPFSHVLEGVEEEEDHKKIGISFIQNRPLGTILHRNHVQPKEIINILNKASNAKYSQLIDSDVDVDKLDYLMRDAHHSGLIYGKIDVDRLIQTLYFDKEGRLCVRFKGRQALENFLLARYYMFTTLYQHRTVYAFELMMRSIYELLSQQKGTKRILSISEATKNPEKWADFDDSYIWSKINNCNSRNSVLKTLVTMLRTRVPLKCVCEEKRMIKESVSKDYHNLFLLYSKPEQKELLAKKSHVPNQWIFVERLRPIHLMSYSEDSEIRIENESGGTIPIRDDLDSIMNLLGKIERDGIRVYTLEKYKEKLKATIGKMYLS